MTFAVVTWYLDHTIDGNRGRRSPPWFVFTWEYWGCKKIRDIREIELKNVTVGSFEREDKDNTVEGLRLDGI
jgi:hypothetical protein